jgi:hypothetical protein
MAARITSVMGTPPSLCGSMTTDELFRWLSINYASMSRLANRWAASHPWHSCAEWLAAAGCRYDRDRSEKTHGAGISFSLEIATPVSRHTAGDYDLLLGADFRSGYREVHVDMPGKLAA